MILRKYILIVLSLFCSISIQAEAWTTMFAYNNVTQIAMSDDCVYGLSDGNIFSVDKQSDRIHAYNTLSSTGANCIYYDNSLEQLIIGYSNGKIDLLTSHGLQYIGELYNKDMTQRKAIYNITIHGRTAYLATHYGVQTLDLRENKLVDSYWLRPGEQETPIADVLIEGDSIYAFSTDSLYSAALSDHLVDYRVWRREQRSGRIAPDSEKGQHYTDGTSDWYAGGGEGIIRFTATERITYKPDGPIVNYCYRIREAGGKVGIVPGGYHSAFFYRPAVVMTREEKKWQNYNNEYIKGHLQQNKVLDFCDIAIDPNNTSHFFVASFGYGLVEFRDNEFYKHYNPSNSALEAVITSSVYPYVWVDGLRFDADGNLWMLNNSVNGVKILKTDSTWLSLSNVACKSLGRSRDLIISTTNPHIKITSDYYGSLGVFDDKGTLDDQSDDEAVLHTYFVEKTTGKTLVKPYILSVFQTSDGDLCVGTSRNGLLHFASPEQLLSGNAEYELIRLNLAEEGREDVFAENEVQCFAEDQEHHIWVGTKLTGLYCLSADLTEILHHCTTDNSGLKSNDIQSLCYSPQDKLLYIGTGIGLTTYLLDESTALHEQPQTNEKDSYSYGNMKRWKTHFSYNSMEMIEDADNKLYGIASHSLVVVDKETDEISPLTKLDGLNGTNVINVSYNTETKKTLVLYQDGLVDILYPDGRIQNMPDIYLRVLTQSTEFYNVVSHKDRTYICSSSGVINVNMRRNEIAETYQLRKGDDDVTIQHICFPGDSICAASRTDIYLASQSANLLNYSVWRRESFPYAGAIDAIGSIGNTIYIHSDSVLYQYSDNKWQQLRADKKWRQLYIQANQLFSRADDSLYVITNTGISPLPMLYTPSDMLRNQQNYWMALPENGIIKWNAAEGTQQYSISSPFENFGYRIRITGDKLIMLPGGYLAANYERYGNVMMYENGTWTNYTYHDIRQITGGNTYYDFCDAAIDPQDPSHFYIASFGFGLHEFRNNTYYQWFLPSNTINGLEAVAEPEWAYTWVDGLSYDANGNLWMLNNSASGVKVLLKNGNWVRYNNAATRNLSRSKDLLIWNQNPNIKIVTATMTNSGVGVFDDKGTISYTGDDRAAYISSFLDQNNKPITPKYVYSICQMANGEVWVGTEAGLFILPDVRKLLDHDNRCRRIIIPRNDGSGLGDYLLADEQINAIVEDAAGRKWIGTENSGLYLMSDDGLETIEHFTNNNSPLTSNGIYALAIHPKSGELFIGTSAGLLSYQSDANDPQADLSSIYAYPNPVTANYAGYITITGLMDNTVVNIIDAGGNLVCKTRSNGGIAIWDGKDAFGKRVTPGIYTALCNANGAHNVCKILVMHETR